ncbi:hypothetical protein ACSS6W_001403 [Trichoderma asperelloides]|uniref:Heat shock protein 42 n=1 Tax=Trichoderma asperellum TaxID=101201 RepID=A0A6V8QNL7_TRIAP|nr:hypothetical protein LI328DRAFT_133706 [Trichoderma asperelloides]GFP53799.1 heat shock protein 42 [Trichoderma asperellum]
MAPHYDNPWDIFHSFYGALNPNGVPPRQPGAGVDHTNAPPPFPFGGPHPPPHGPFPFTPNDFPDEADWAGRGGRGRRNRSPHYHDYPQAYTDNVNTGTAQTNTSAARVAENEKGSHDASPDTAREGEEFPDPAEVTPSESDGEDHGHEGVPPPFYSSEDPSGRRGRRGGPHGRGGWGHAHAHGHGRGGRCGGRRGGWRRGFGGPFGGGPGAGGPGGPPPHHPPPPHPPFDFPGMMRGFMDHPFFQNLRDQAERYYRPADRNAQQQQQPEEADDTFTPPVDIFNTPTAFILHAALPGAKKDHIGVTWNPQSRTLRIAGVVHRPGDEAFLQTLTTVRERRVGVFEKEVKLPPAGVAEEDQDVEVDGSGITAKMEEGVLIVTVPKVEKEWMEVRKVDIE